MPSGLSITTKPNLLAGNYTLFYSRLVMLWPPLSHSKGKKEFFLTSPWLQHLFKISYNIPNIGKKALPQGSAQFLCSHNRHLQVPLRSLALLGQLWLGRGLEWACQSTCAYTSPSKRQNAVQFAKPNAEYSQGTLSGVSLNLLSDLICPRYEEGALEFILSSWGSWTLDSGPEVCFLAKKRHTSPFALQDICREETKG